MIVVGTFWKTKTDKRANGIGTGGIGDMEEENLSELAAGEHNTSEEDRALANRLLQSLRPYDYFIDPNQIGYQTNSLRPAVDSLKGSLPNLCYPKKPCCRKISLFVYCPQPDIVETENLENRGKINYCNTSWVYDCDKEKWSKLE